MGRKRRKGDNRKRTPSGQLSRAGVRTGPSEWVAAMLAKFGNHYNSALGRAYASGLLGDGNEAKARLDAGNRFASRHVHTLGGAYTCPLDQTPRGSNDNADGNLRHQLWLFAAGTALDEKGLRPSLDQLIHRLYTDAGPPWLDRLIAGENAEGDWIVMRAAIRALDVVDRVPEQHDRPSPALRAAP